MVLTYYYDLKTKEKLLPPNTPYTDPYDGHVFTTKDKETLDDFLKRINDYRAKHKYPLLPIEQGRALIISMLVATIDDSVRNMYFRQATALPTMAQALSFGRALAYETLHANTVTQKQRVERAMKCLKCPHHKSKFKTKESVAKHELLSKAHVKAFEENTYNDNATIPTSLGTCGVCNCPMNVKVKFQLEGILAGIYPEQLTMILNTQGGKAFKNCWILSEAIKDEKLNQVLYKKLAADEKSAETNTKLFNTFELTEQLRRESKLKVIVNKLNDSKIIKTPNEENENGEEG